MSRIAMALQTNKRQPQQQQRQEEEEEEEEEDKQIKTNHVFFSLLFVPVFRNGEGKFL